MKAMMARPTFDVFFLAMFPGISFVAGTVRKFVIALIIQIQMLVSTLRVRWFDSVMTLTMTIASNHTAIRRDMLLLIFTMSADIVGRTRARYLLKTIRTRPTFSIIDAKEITRSSAIFHDGNFAFSAHPLDFELLSIGRRCEVKGLPTVADKITRPFFVTSRTLTAVSTKKSEKKEPKSIKKVCQMALS